MAISRQAQAAQMIAQLRLLDPSMSAEVGTPERKIIDTVAQAIYDNAIDLDALSAGLDLDAKYGAQLDRFLAIFGFTRQKATYATGFVTFSRVAPANVDIRIPAGAVVQAPAQFDDPNADLSSDVRFATTFDVTIPAGSVSVVAPIRAVLPGRTGNVAAGRVTEIIAQTIYGVTAVTNEVATAGGLDVETDEALKVRFKNTVFRNLAGTQDQYMALAVATAFTSKANVVGPQSHYREYVQVPPVADNASYDVSGGGMAEAGGGNAGEYTTALSTVPFAKYIYATEFPVFVHNGQAGLGSIFYRQDTDFKLNTTATAANRGDARRLFNLAEGGTALDENPATATNRPNVTFMNVYTGTNSDVQAIRPGDVVLLEFGYLSSASRNDPANKITNAVDVYIDGGNDTFATTVVTRPTTATAFVDDPASKFHYENFRRAGDPAKRPLIGNVLLQLFWQPVLDLPSEIVVGDVTYYKDVHYWPVQDTSALGGSIRARGGIEFSTTVAGRSAGDPIATNPGSYTGRVITDATGDPTGGQPIEVANYMYDKNIVDLQAALEGAKQVTTDVLAHRAKLRYFKLDVTAMYVAGVSVADTNLQVQEAVDSYLRSQYFGSVIQLSDLLQVIHSVPGIDNVRWTADLQTNTTTPRVYETDVDGRPLLGVTTERRIPGGVSQEQQSIFISGQPTGGYFRFEWNGNYSTDIAYNASAATMLTALQAISGMPASMQLIEDTRTTTGVRYGIRSLRAIFNATGQQPYLIQAAGPSASNLPLRGGHYVKTNDFFLLDDELARLPSSAYTPLGDAALTVPDTVPGLIIRPRAQNTWVRSQ